MTRYHRAFDAAYRAAVALARTRRTAGLPRSDALAELGSTIDFTAGLTDEHRKLVHAALEVDPELRHDVRATLTPELAGTAAWLWLGREPPEWEKLVRQLLDADDRHRRTEIELERLKEALDERTTQWRQVMRQLSAATAELDRRGSPLAHRSPEQPLSDADWDEILGRDH